MRKYVFYALILGTPILFFSPSFAGFENRGVPFYDQLQYVRKWVEQRAQNHGIVFMVFGARSDDKNIPKQEFTSPYETKWIFFDVNEHETLSGLPYIRADFNNLEDLLCIKSVLGEQLDGIYMDSGVSPVTQWTLDHLSCLKDMLKIGGKFVYNDVGQGIKVWRNSEGHPLEIQKLPLYENLSDALDAMCKINFNLDGWGFHTARVRFNESVKVDEEALLKQNIKKVAAEWVVLKKLRLLRYKTLHIFLS